MTSVVTLYAIEEERAALLDTRERLTPAGRRAIR